MVGDTYFISSWQTGLYSYDISNPKQPVELDHVQPGQVHQLQWAAGRPAWGERRTDRQVGVRHGRSIPMPSGTIGNTGSSGGNVPINKFYVTLMNALGCTAEGGGPVESFGKFDGNKEPDGIKNPGEVDGLKA